MFKFLCVGAFAEPEAMPVQLSTNQRENFLRITFNGTIQQPTFTP
jgi:hypothetical protein